MITPPAKGEPVDKLWEKVVKCCEMLNAIENMEVLVETIDPTKGTIVFSEGKATLKLY